MKNFATVWKFFVIHIIILNWIKELLQSKSFPMDPSWSRKKTYLSSFLGTAIWSFSYHTYDQNIQKFSSYHFLKLRKKISLQLFSWLVKLASWPLASNIRNNFGKLNFSDSFLKINKYGFFFYFSKFSNIH